MKIAKWKLAMFLAASIGYSTGVIAQDVSPDTYEYDGDSQTEMESDGSSGNQAEQVPPKEMFSAPPHADDGYEVHDHSSHDHTKHEHGSYGNHPERQPHDHQHAGVQPNRCRDRQHDHAAADQSG